MTRFLSALLLLAAVSATTTTARADDCGNNCGPPGPSKPEFRGCNAAELGTRCVTDAGTTGLCLQTSDGDFICATCNVFGTRDLHVGADCRTSDGQAGTCQKAEDGELNGSRIKSDLAFVCEPTPGGCSSSPAAAPAGFMALVAAASLLSLWRRRAGAG